ncbi:MULTISPECIES: GNAT family N-acetyltransferase [Kamptonema]|uniref:GNAT family N-acetyltransferase n=1 Tax=Kamptonema TaxID=1501433 RepID=UPI0001DACC99|nr:MULTISPECIES: GNAT family N-acetyltransferase [Kamptonema]CBN57547.1 GCN5-related N-acetyltransferase [Kamptonema sp. PCC 6506]
MNSTTRDYRNIQFCIGSEQVDLHQLKGLFKGAAFWARERSLLDLETALRFSEPVVSVWDGDRMIGFARATSDGIYRATIWDVVINPDYQGGGLGRKLVQTVLSHPRMCRVERVYLMTTYKQSFYERIGFQCNASTTMVLENQPIDANMVLENQPLDANMVVENQPIDANGEVNFHPVKLTV